MKTILLKPNAFCTGLQAILPRLRNLRLRMGFRAAASSGTSSQLMDRRSPGKQAKSPSSSQIYVPRCFTPTASPIINTVPSSTRATRYSVAAVAKVSGHFKRMTVETQWLFSTSIFGARCLSSHSKSLNEAFSSARYRRPTRTRLFNEMGPHREDIHRLSHFVQGQQFDN